GAVRAEEAGDRTLLDLEAHLVHGAEVAVELGDAIELEDVHAGVILARGDRREEQGKASGRGRGRWGGGESARQARGSPSFTFSLQNPGERPPCRQERPLA